jgi:hypothetical protein
MPRAAPWAWQSQTLGRTLMAFHAPVPGKSARDKHFTPQDITKG